MVLNITSGGLCPPSLSATVNKNHLRHSTAEERLRHLLTLPDKGSRKRNKVKGLVGQCSSHWPDSWWYSGWDLRHANYTCIYTFLKAIWNSSLPISLLPTLHTQILTRTMWEDDWGAWDWSKILKDQEDFKWRQRLEDSHTHNSKRARIQWETRVSVKKNQQIEGPDHLHKEFVFNSIWNGDSLVSFIHGRDEFVSCHPLPLSGRITTKVFEHLAPLPRLFLILLRSLENFCC